MTAHNTIYPRSTTPKPLKTRPGSGIDKKHRPVPVRNTSPSSEISETDHLRRNIEAQLQIVSRPSTPALSTTSSTSSSSSTSSTTTPAGKVVTKSKPVRNQHKNGKRRIVEIAQGPAGEVLLDCTYDTLSKSEQLQASEFLNPITDASTGKTVYRTKISKFTTITITTTTVVSHTLTEGDENFEEARRLATGRSEAGECRRWIPECHRGQHERVHGGNTNHCERQR